jgi:hypothetical protein
MFQSPIPMDSNGAAFAPPLGACRMHCWELPVCTWLNDFKDVNDARLLETESLVTIGSSHRRQEEQMEPP